MKNVICVMAVFSFGLHQSFAATDVTVNCRVSSFHISWVECGCENDTILEYNDTLKFEVENADSVTSLQIGRTFIMTNISNIFRTFRYLLKLNVHSNMIVLQHDSFRDASTLKELYLSENHILTLPDNVFDGMVNLEVIDLSYNQIYEVHRMTFTGAPNIKYIGLSGNAIKTIEDDSFNLPNLECLVLEDNKVTDISHAFGNMTKLKELRLANNSIDTINKGSLNLANLEVLSLQLNNLTTVDTLLNGLPNLKFIDLSYNQIYHIGNTFTNRKKLKHLNLARNPIEDINLTEFSNLESLQNLDISSTGYKLPNEVHANFTNSSRLERLTMRNNHLTNPDIFKHLAIFPRLKYLYLYRNPFTSLNDIDKIRDYLPEIEKVYVSGNSLFCDWFRNTVDCTVPQKHFIGCGCGDALLFS